MKVFGCLLIVSFRKFLWVVALKFGIGVTGLKGRQVKAQMQKNPQGTPFSKLARLLQAIFRPSGMTSYLQQIRAQETFVREIIAYVYFVEKGRSAAAKAAKIAKKKKR